MDSLKSYNPDVLSPYPQMLKTRNIRSIIVEMLEDFKNEFSDLSLDQKNENYKNPADFNKVKTFLKLKDQLVEANEYIEYLLNTTLSFALTVPEEVAVEPVKRKGFWSRILSWLKKVFFLTG